MLQDQLKRMKHSAVWAIVMEGTPAALQGSEIQVVFPKSHEFHYRKACGDHKPIIEEALSAVLGQQVTIACSQGEVPPAGSAGLSPAVSPAAVETPTPPEEDETPTPPETAAQEAVEQAVRQTLDLFEGSQELPER